MNANTITLNKSREITTISRAFDYLMLVPVVLVLIGSFHLSTILTVGDWDFWLD